MARTIAQSLNCSLSNLPHEKRLQAIEHLRELLFEHECAALTEQATYDAQGRIVYCAECGSVHVRRYGKRGGRQRWRCADCGRTFTDSGPRSMIDASHLPRATWMRFIECFVDDLSLAKCAANCGVSVKTAHYMRMRVLKLIADSRPEWRLAKGQTAQIDETFVYESFKGNRTKCEGFEMPRAPYVRGRAHDKRYLKGQGKSNADHICIATGVTADDRSTFFELGGRAVLTTDEARRILEPKVKRGSSVITDELPAYQGVLKSLGARHVRFNSRRSNGSLNEVNALHSHFKAFMKRRHGVSTRRLHLYTAEFAWRWENGISTSATKDAAHDIVRQIAVTDFTTVGGDFRAAEYPYIEWWGTEEGRLESLRREIAELQHAVDCARRDAGGDPELERAVDERQAALDARAEEAEVEIRSRARAAGPSKSAPQLTLSMLRRAEG